MKDSRLSFSGCTSRAEAVARFRRFAEQILAAADRRLETDLISRADDFDDVDQVVDAIGAAREHNAELLPLWLGEFEAFLEREGIGPSPHGEQIGKVA